MNFCSVLLETKDASASSSAVLIDGKFVLTTCHTLQDFTCQHEQLLDQLQPGQLFLHPEQAVNFRILTKTQANGLTAKNASLFGLLKCKHMEKFCRKDFKDWITDVPDGNVDVKRHIAIFLICVMDDFPQPDFKEELLKAALLNWISNVGPVNVAKGEQVLCKSTPFGNRDFLNSFSEGIISTEIKTGHLYLSDCSSAPGCEGGLIFSKKNLHIPIGLVISSLNWWRKEWLGFTLIVDIRPILSQMVGRNDVFMKVGGGNASKLIEIADNGLAQVNCGTNWGTAVLVSRERGIFLTNSHVIRQETNIRLFWKSKSANAKLIYHLPEDAVFDLAVLQTVELALHMTSPGLNSVCCNKGQPVFCAGFPLLSTLTRPEGVTITKGIVSESQKYILQTTCSVYPGFSGGAVLSENGALLGIVVCNMGLTGGPVVYPKCNLAIPLAAIEDTLSRYIQSGDPEALAPLQSSDSEAIWRWRKLEGKL